MFTDEDFAQLQDACLDRTDQWVEIPPGDDPHVYINGRLFDRRTHAPPLGLELYRPRAAVTLTVTPDPEEVAELDPWDFLLWLDEATIEELERFGSYDFDQLDRHISGWGYRIF